MSEYITLDSKTYIVDETFDGSPAAFRGTKHTYIGHVDEQDDSVEYTFDLKPGTVVILATPTEPEDTNDVQV